MSLEDFQAQIQQLDSPSVVNALNTCLKQILSYKQNKDHNQAIIQNIREQCNPDQNILSCASCGETFAEMRDKIRGKKPIGYYHCLRDLEIMRLTEQETVSYLAMNSDYRKVKGVYPSDDSRIKYHLHPQYVRIPNEVPEELIGNHEACLCLNCHEGIISNPKKLYKYSLSKGCDYGDIRRLPAHLQYRELNTAEKMATAMAIPYCVIIKLAIQHVGNRLKLNSHAITFPSGGVETMSDQAIRTLPHPPEIIKQHLKVNIIGTGTFKEIRSCLLLGKTQVKVEATEIYKHLRYVTIFCYFNYLNINLFFLF